MGQVIADGLRGKSKTIIGENKMLRCFLDIDGVLADFVGGVNKVFGFPAEFPPPKQDGTPWWNWFESYGFTSEQINDICTINFWANLEWMHDGRQILDVVENHFYPTFTNHPDPASLKPTYFENQIYLLTTPMPHPGSWTGKMLWVEKHLPQYAKHFIVTQAAKSLLAGPDCLLIDDKDENIDEFVAAGGMGILVPRPWNGLRGWADDTLEVVLNSLRGVY